MIPILFSENSTVFTSNGIGRLSDAISCYVTEERNGQYELQMIYPSTGVHFDDINLRAIIVAKPSAGANNQPFRIYNISRPINGKVTINAQHISYDLSKNVCMPFSITASASACSQALAGIKANAVETCPFTFTTDVTTVANYNQSSPASIRSRLGGTEGSVLDQFHGEYEWDVYDVILHKDRGTIKNIPLRYGKNITDIKQEEEISQTITGIVPFWADNEGNNLVTLPEKVVYSPNASLYPQKLTVPMDFSSDFQEQPTEAQLRAHAQVYVNQSGVGIPKVSIDVSFVNLADTEEYKDLIALQAVELCDTIPVQFEPLGIDTDAKIVKTEYDTLAEKYTKITVGSLRSNLATTITEQNQSIVTETSAKFGKVGNEIDNATAWLTSSGGYVVAVKNQDGSWKELLFLDDNDIDEAVNVLRINENGIGFSSNGVSGPYTQAWTLDGRLVIGGTNVPSITVYDNQSNIIFQASATAVIWNADNSAMDSDGYITMNGASITGGTIEQGGQYYKMVIEDGNLYVQQVSTGTTVGQISMVGSITDRGAIEVIGKNTALIGVDLDDSTVVIGSGIQFGIPQYDNVSVVLHNGQTATYYTGAEDSETYISEIDYETYNFTTDLEINDIGGGDISWSYTNVTMSVATGHTSRTLEVTKGFVTGM
jgi:phage minor structural protein